MAVGRTVAATDVTTGQAEPQVDPLVADAQTILATFSRRCDLSDLVSVFTRTVHIAFLSQVIFQTLCAAPRAVSLSCLLYTSDAADE